MPIISDRITIYNRDGTTETLPADQARYKTYVSPGEWSLTPPPPPGWKLSTPKYRATRNVRPSPNSRHRHEPPFATIFDVDVWQYATRPVAAFEELESREWPHESFRAMNYAAEQVLAYFKSAMKSRLARSPFRGDRIELSDGISGVLSFEVKGPKPQPMNLRPVA
jgi:hypothetical protein